MQETPGESFALPSGEQIGLARYGANDGYPVLSLHGAPACRLMFAPADEAAQKYGLSLICPDRPGYGLSKSLQPLTMQTRVDHLTQLVDALGLSEFGVLGISGGGPYATALAATLGKRIKFLGLVSPLGPVADFNASEPTGDQKLHLLHDVFFLRLANHPMMLRVQANVAAAALKNAPQMSAEIFLRSLPQADSEILRQDHIGESFLEMTLEALRHGTDGGIDDLEIFSKSWDVDFEKITAPTVVWQGSEDRIVPVVVTKFLAGKIKGANYIEIDGAGHFWIYNNIDATLAELRKIVNGG